MIKRINKLFKIDIVRHNTIFLIGTLLISFFNYLYYPIISRLVSVVEFGEIQAAISIFMQLGILLTAFGYVVTNIAGNGSGIRMSNIILRLERLTLIVALVLLAVLVIFGYQLKTTFQFTSIMPLLLIGVLVILNVPSTARSYVLQGLRQLKEVSISGIIFSVTKLLFSVVCIVLGMSVEGAIVGYIIAQLLTLFYLELKSRHHFPNLKNSFKRLKGVDMLALKNEVRFGVLVIVVLFCAALLYSFDVVIARLFLDAEAAGAYSGVSSVARIIYFATASVAGVLIASVKVNDSVSRSRRVLGVSTAMVAGIGLSILCIFTIFPELSIGLLLGRDYLSGANLLPLTGSFMFIASINNLLLSFQIAQRKMSAVIAVVVGCLILSGYLVLNHSDVYDLIYGYLLANLVVLVILVIQIMKREKNE